MYYDGSIIIVESPMSIYTVANTGVGGQCVFLDFYGNSVRCKCCYYFHFM